MKIYKLDMDTAQPTRQVVVMQQNSLGLLSVDVERNDWPIRNLSCTLLDGESEISACLSGESGAGFKLDVGEDAKAVKLVAKSTPIECSAQYVLSVASGAKPYTKSLVKATIPAGVYKQDEFNSIAEEFGNKSGFTTMLIVPPAQRPNANFAQIALMPWIVDRPYYFYEISGANVRMLSPEELITVSADTQLVMSATGRGTPTLSSYTYPAIGYYTDHTQEAVIRPSTNAPCWGERDIVEPEPEPDPEPEPEPDPEPTPEET